MGTNKDYSVTRGLLALKATVVGVALCYYCLCTVASLGELNKLCRLNSLHYYFKVNLSLQFIERSLVVQYTAKTKLTRTGN